MRRSKAEKNSAASFLVVAEINRPPSWATLPPTSALSLYFTSVARSPKGVSSTSTSPFTDPPNRPVRSPSTMQEFGGLISLKVIFPCRLALMGPIESTTVQCSSLADFASIFRHPGMHFWRVAGSCKPAQTSETGAAKRPSPSIINAISCPFCPEKCASSEIFGPCTGRYHT